mmetsp:Transcript_25693/g.58665  ORF Transcript_25693/g.58665 Transcript_25693/m.58665 type:complete len:273 (-) Transcript_25693:928-1746(-)
MAMLLSVSSPRLHTSHLRTNAVVHFSTAPSSSTASCSRTHSSNSWPSIPRVGVHRSCCPPPPCVMVAPAGSGCAGSSVAMMWYLPASYPASNAVDNRSAPASSPSFASLMFRSHAYGQRTLSGSSASKLSTTPGVGRACVAATRTGCGRTTWKNMHATSLYWKSPVPPLRRLLASKHTWYLMPLLGKSVSTRRASSIDGVKCSSREATKYCAFPMAPPTSTSTFRDGAPASLFRSSIPLVANSVAPLGRPGLDLTEISTLSHREQLPVRSRL